MRALPTLQKFDFVGKFDGGGRCRAGIGIPPAVNALPPFP